MKVAMLDTNVLLDLMKNEKKALEKLKDFKGYEFVISFLVYSEIMAGVTIKGEGKYKEIPEKIYCKRFRYKST